MVNTKEALIASGLSAGAVWVIYHLTTNYWINNPALVESNKTLTGFVVAASVFIIGFVGMKWNEWTK